MGIFGRNTVITVSTDHRALSGVIHRNIAVGSLENVTNYALKGLCNLNIAFVINRANLDGGSVLAGVVHHLTDVLIELIDHEHRALLPDFASSGLDRFRPVVTSAELNVI